MSKFIEYPCIIFSIISTAFAFLCIQGDRKKHVENIYAFFFNLGSAAWSFFFGNLIVQESEHTAYIFRCLGMVGTFLYLIMAIFLIARLSNVKKWIKFAVNLFALFAIPLYFLNIRPEASSFFLTEYGMTYQFAGDIWMILYYVYSCIMGLNSLAICIYMLRKGSRNREKSIARKMIACIVALFIGSIFDTILPNYGLAALPISTIAQFFGSIVVMSIVSYVNSTRISVSNLSKYVYSSIKAPFLIYSEKRELTLFNNGAAELFGITEKTKSDFGISYLFEVSEDTLNQAADTFSVDAKCRVREMYCCLEITVIRDNYGDLVGYIVFVNDITERIRSINQLKEARKSADDANNAKSDFLANMSHEIRTPINTVLGMNELIIRESRDANIVTYAEDIKNAGESLLALVNDVLDFSKIEAGKLELVSEAYRAKNLFRGILTMFIGRIEEKGLKLNIEISPDLPANLYGDYQRIRQILVNLLSNAVKYTKEGQISFKVRGRDRYENFLMIEYEVSDTGIGIKAEDKDKLFSTFVRLDEKKNRNIEGTGLGLGIVKRLTELMGGQIDVKSEYGKGSTFTVTIMQEIMGDDHIGSFELTEEPKLAGSYAPSFITQGAKILVVDDNKMNLSVIQGLLKGMGLRIDTALSGQKCLELVAETKYDIIFLDHMMPEMDGLQTLAHIKEEENSLNADTIAIALTANALSGAKKQYLEAGFDDYLSKPVEYKALEKMLKVYLPNECIIEQDDKPQSEPADSSMNAEELPPISISLGDDIDDNGTMEEEALKPANEPSNPSDAGRTIEENLRANGIDLEAAYKYCVSFDIFKASAEAYCESCNEYRENLRNYFEAGDGGNYRILIHGVKANARMLGCGILYEEAYKQEQLCVGDVLGVTEADVEIAVMLVTTLEDVLREYVVTSYTVELPDESREDIDDATFKEKLNGLLELADSYEDSEFTEGIDELLRYNLGQETIETLKAARDSMKLFNYDKASELIKSLILM